MKGLILSGGRGTRLRPITYTRAKQLVPVANKPVLFYGLEALVAAGIRDIGIVVGDTQAEIRAAVGDGSRWGARISYIEQDAPRGLAHAVLISEAFIGRDPFVMYLGDNLLNHGITHFVEAFDRERPAAQILLARVPDPQMFGVAELADGRVVRLVEKPKEPRSDLALVGVYMFGPEVFEAVKRIRPSFRNELEITDAIQDLIDRSLEVRPHIVQGWWKDTGKLEDMLEANRLILDTFERRIDGAVDDQSRIEGKVVIEAGATVERSVVRGPVIIGAGATIKGAYVGPFTAVGERVTIRDTEIEHSIVLEGAVLTDLANRIEDSLIGRHVSIYRLPVRPSAYRFMLGDNSEVGDPVVNVLVTGGAGFIGSNFVRWAHETHPDWHLTTLDKLTYAGRLENLRAVEGSRRHTFVKGDIADEATAAPLIRAADLVVHFAAETHVDRSILAAGDFIRTDVFGTFVLLEAARTAPHLSRFVQISTDEVYGSVPEGSSRETDELKPRNPYSASKAAADRLAYSYWATYQVPVLITRASNNYGPNQFPEKVIPLFITNALDQRPLPLYGDGQNVRDWLHVEDHCRALDVVIARGTPGEVYNIGGGHEVRNVDLARRILELTDQSPSLIQAVADRPGHDRRYALDTARLRALGWAPQQAFDAGLSATVAWYRQHEWWWRPIKDRDPAFRAYYRQQYGEPSRA